MVAVGKLSYAPLSATHTQPWLKRLSMPTQGYATVDSKLSADASPRLVPRPPVPRQKKAVLDPDADAATAIFLKPNPPADPASALQKRLSPRALQAATPKLKPRLPHPAVPVTPSRKPVEGQQRAAPPAVEADAKPSAAPLFRSLNVRFQQEC